jgi:hypothetical protein
MGDRSQAASKAVQRLAIGVLFVLLALGMVIFASGQAHLLAAAVAIVVAGGYFSWAWLASRQD